MGRKEAIANCDLTYDTGAPCRNGHLSPRYTRSGNCIVCSRSRTAKWKNNNPSKVQQWNALRWENATRDYKILRNRMRRIARRKYFHLGNVPLDIGEKQLVKNLYDFCIWLTEETGVPMEVDHVVPLSKGGKHHPSNLRIITAVENRRKGGKLSVAEPFP